VLRGIGPTPVSPAGQGRRILIRINFVCNEFAGSSVAEATFRSGGVAAMASPPLSRPR
jgi:hypothetical protein